MATSVRIARKGHRTGLMMMPLASPPDTGRLLQAIGKFEITARLGQGGMGTVYRARDPFLDRRGRAQDHLARAGRATPSS